MVGPLIEARLVSMRRSQADLVRELERAGAAVSKQSVSNWVSGKTRPDDSHMHVLFAVLVIPLDEQPSWWAARAGREIVAPVALEDRETVIDDTPCSP